MTDNSVRIFPAPPTSPPLLTLFDLVELVDAVLLRRAPSVVLRTALTLADAGGDVAQLGTIDDFLRDPIMKVEEGGGL